MSEDKIDERFDKAEKFWDRLQKLILKVVGGIVGICLAVYVGYDQIVNKDIQLKVRESVVIDHAQVDTVKVHSEDYELTKMTFFVDDYGLRKGDTVHVDYYSDGYIERYYKNGDSYVDDYVKDSTSE